MSRDHLRNKLGRHFSIFLAMSDTQEFLFLDSALLKQAVDMKKMKNLKKKEMPGENYFRLFIFVFLNLKKFKKILRSIIIILGIHS